MSREELTLEVKMSDPYWRGFVRGRAACLFNIAGHVRELVARRSFCESESDMQTIRALTALAEELEKQSRER